MHIVDLAIAWVSACLLAIFICGTIAALHKMRK